MKTLVLILMAGALFAGCGDKNNPDHYSSTGMFSTNPDNGQCNGDACRVGG